MASYKLCHDCGYKNDIKYSNCHICSSKNLVLEKDKENNISNFVYIFLIVIVVLISCFIYFDNKKKKTSYEKIPVFISEKRPINYYTYMRSLKKLSQINDPDENDEKAVKTALKYSGEFRQIGIEILKKWSENDKINADKRGKYKILIEENYDK